MGSQLRANPYKVPLDEIYRVPSPKQVHFQPSEQEEEEWENLSVDNGSADFVPPAQALRLDESAVPPIERNTDIPAEITLLLEEMMRV